MSDLEGVFIPPYILSEEKELERDLSQDPLTPRDMFSRAYSVMKGRYSHSIEPWEGQAEGEFEIFRRNEVVAQMS